MLEIELELKTISPITDLTLIIFLLVVQIFFLICLKKTVLKQFRTLGQFDKYNIEFKRMWRNDCLYTNVPIDRGGKIELEKHLGIIKFSFYKPSFYQ